MLFDLIWYQIHCAKIIRNICKQCREFIFWPWEWKGFITEYKALCCWSWLERLASVIYDMVFETKQLLKKFCIVEAGWLLIIFLTHSHERPRLVGTDASWTGGPGFRLKMKSNCQRKQQKRNLSNTNKRGSVILDLSSCKYLRKQNLATVGLNKMLRFPVCITAICALFLTKLQQRNCRCNCDVTGEESFTAKEMSSYK